MTDDERERFLDEKPNGKWWSYFDLDGTKCTRRRSFEIFENLELRRVGLDEINGFTISTVFLGIDHSWSYHDDEDNHTPILYETMVFGGTGKEFAYSDEVQTTRYATRPEALAGHAYMVAWVRAQAAVLTAEKLIADLQAKREADQEKFVANAAEIVRAYQQQKG